MGTVQIAAVAPGLFTVDASGRGLPAATVLRVKADDSQISEPIARFDQATGKFVPVPIDFGPATDRVYLILYGTGIRYHNNLSAVTMTRTLRSCTPERSRNLAMRFLLCVSYWQRGDCPRVRSHIVWEDNHTHNPRTHDPIITDGTKKLNALKAKFPGVDVQVSPFCEHNIKGAELAALMKKVRDVANGQALVNSPWTGDMFEGAVNEIHSALRPISGVYNFSYDGLSCVDSDVEKFKQAHANALTFFFWEPRFNGRWETKDKTPREQRKGYPDGKLIDSMIYLAKSRGATSLPQKWISASLRTSSLCLHPLWSAQACWGRGASPIS